MYYKNYYLFYLRYEDKIIFIFSFHKNLIHSENLICIFKINLLEHLSLLILHGLKYLH